MRKRLPQRVGIWTGGGDKWGVFFGDGFDGLGYHMTVDECENLIRRLADQMRLARKRNHEIARAT